MAMRSGANDPNRRAEERNHPHADAWAGRDRDNDDAARVGGEARLVDVGFEP